MIRKNRQKMVWYEFELLQPFQIKHGVFTKRGGVSDGAYASLNLGETVGDLPEAVAENKRRVAKALDIPPAVFLNQVHSSKIEVIQGARESFQADGMMTNQKNLPLAIRHADCQAAVFYDPVHHALANIHAGWRGQVQNIYAQTVRKMRKLYKSRPEDLIVCISPSLGPRFAEFKGYQSELIEEFWIHKVGQCHFNFWEIARDQLLRLSILEDQIEIASLCTYENPEEFFSYRRAKITGRNVTVAALI